MKSMRNVTNIHGVDDGRHGQRSDLQVAQSSASRGPSDSHGRLRSLADSLPSLSAAPRREPRPPVLVAICWLALLFVAAPLCAEDTPQREGLTIATYNVKNMFDVFDDPFTLDEGTPVKPRRELERVAAVIRHLNADIVALQELENEQILKAVVKEWLGDMGYEHIAACQTNDVRGITLGVISRVPIESVTSYRHRDLSLPGKEKTWRFARDLMHVKLAVTDSRTLDLFVVHYKSKRTVEKSDKEGGTWRLAEATATRRIIDRALAGRDDAWAVLCGDLNDTPGTPPLEALTGGQAADGLVDLHASIQPENRITYLSEPYRSTIDYILASPALAKGAVKDSAKVLADEKLLRGSDHAPVVVTFDVRKE